MNNKLKIFIQIVGGFVVLGIIITLTWLIPLIVNQLPHAILVLIAAAMLTIIFLEGYKITKDLLES